MSDHFSPATWSARNPLGIVALFISLIYGMSALLLGAAITSLTPANQTILVIFIAVFPFVVLTVFAWLVANHHRKLYGPGDYRSDEGFLSAGGPLSPSEFQQRIDATVDSTDTQDDSNQGAPAAIDQTSGSQPQLPSLPAEASGQTPEERRKDRAEVAAQAYLAEGLVLHELQAEFGGSVTREAVIQSPDGWRLIFDGLIQTSKDQFVVEVKLARSPSSLAKTLSNAGVEFWRYREALTSLGTNNARFVLALVLDEKLSMQYATELVQKYRSRFGEDVIVRLYPIDQLLKKYKLT